MKNLSKRLAGETCHALDDYFYHVKCSYTNSFLSKVNKEIFCEKYAAKVVRAKSKLRNLFRLHPEWNETLQAVVIKKKLQTECDKDELTKKLRRLLQQGITDKKFNIYQRNRVIAFFTKKRQYKNPDCEYELKVLRALAPHAYHKNKKLTRILNDFCYEVGIADPQKASKYQKLYAEIAKLLSDKQVEETIFVSIHPAHMLTMSNPKADTRGEMLTTCHSLNSFVDNKQGGPTGLGYDEVSFIVFTVKNPEDTCHLNSRKTTRQLFAYTPQNGVLLQSRLYNSKEISNQKTPRTESYLSAVKEIIDEAEKNHTSWKTIETDAREYDRTMYALIKTHDDYIGCEDWRSVGSSPTISLKENAPQKPITLGAPSLCFGCGEPIIDAPRHLVQFCQKCDKTKPQCEICKKISPNDGTTAVIAGLYKTIKACDECHSQTTICEFCGKPAMKRIAEIFEDKTICPRCVAEKNLQLCDDCGKLVSNADAEVIAIEPMTIILSCQSCIRKRIENGKIIL